MAEHTEKTLSSEMKYTGPVFTVYSDRVLLENGHESRRDYLKHNGAVAIVAVTPEGKVIMEKQFRYPHNRTVMEVPAGKLEKTDVVPLDAAIRELSEETGYTAREFIPLGRYVSSPAILSEVIYVYLAVGLEKGEVHLDEGEFLDVEEYPLDELVNMIMADKICDGKTVYSLLKAKLYFEREGEVWKR